MAIDNIARGLALSLLNNDGKFSADLMPPIEIKGKTQFTVGGLASGTSLEGKTIEEVLLMILFGVSDPTLTDPSLIVRGGPALGVAGQAFNVTGQIEFNRGSISPAHGTSGFRAGLPISYSINDEIQLTQETVIDFSYQIDKLAKGNNSITIIVNYSEGEQPLNSLGGEFDKPLPAGQLSYTLTVVGQNPIYAGLVDGIEINLADSYFDLTDISQGAGYLITSAAEIEFTDKWSISFPSEISIVGIKQYDILSQSWQWLGGSPAASLSYFNQTVIQRDINGELINYTTYSNALDQVGERQLKFYTILPEGE